MTRRRRHRGTRPRRFWRWPLRLLLLATLWLAAVAAWIVYVGNRDQARAADAIVVLGAAAYDTRPSPVFTERIRHGIDLYERGYARALVFTGGGAPWMLVPLGLMLATTIAFAVLVGAPTAAGRALLDEIEGGELVLPHLVAQRRHAFPVDHRPPLASL